MTTMTWPDSDRAAGELRQMIEELRAMLQARKESPVDGLDDPGETPGKASVVSGLDP
jgi:hypothetical protein